MADKKAKQKKKDLSLLKATVAKAVREATASSMEEARTTLFSLPTGLLHYVLSDSMHINDYEIGKVTDSAVKEFVDSHRGIERKERELIECEYHYSLLQGIVQAFEDRSYRITNIVDLTLRNYDAQSITNSANTAERFAEYQKQQLKEIRNGNAC
jgi:predicted transcriptional regulator